MNRRNIAIELIVALGCLVVAGAVLWYYLGHRPRAETSTRTVPAASSSAPLPNAPVPARQAPVPVATGTPPENCPQWVNCMPGPDVSTTCVVPPGCENYTQKAY